MDPSQRDTLQYIFERSFSALPGTAAAARRRELADEYEDSPLAYMVGGSPLLNYARQRLPENVGATAAGQWLLRQAPEKQRKLAEKIGSIPLGGFSRDQLDAFDDLRSRDPEVERHTVRVGRVPTPLGEVPTGDSFRAATAQASGVALGDLASDGLRNIWWFLNAPQALAQVAMLQGLHRAGEEYQPPDRAGSPLIKNRTIRMAATLPAVVGISMAIGNAYRQPGYKAAVPSERDATQSADPLAELGARYFLGRSGALLPYDEFVKERPDVSKGEYEAYKSYLFGNALPLKATLEGIHGPEVTFMGKSIPVATGVLPAAAAVIGGIHGIRKAGHRLRNSGALEDAAEMKRNWSELKKESRNPQSGVTEQDVSDAYRAYEDQQQKNERDVALQAILYSSMGMGGTAIAGQTLESIRRALKGKAPIEPPEESVELAE